MVIEPESVEKALMLEQQNRNIVKKTAILPEAGKFSHRITLELTNRCNLNCTFCPRRLMGNIRVFRRNINGYHR